MKQVLDVHGNKITGLYKKDDGSFVVVDKDGFKKSQSAKATINGLKNEVNTLKEQMAKIMEMLNVSNM